MSQGSYNLQFPNGQCDVSGGIFVDVIDQSKSSSNPVCWEIFIMNAC